MAVNASTDCRTSGRAICPAFTDPDPMQTSVPLPEASALLRIAAERLTGPMSLRP